MVDHFLGNCNRKLCSSRWQMNFLTERRLRRQPGSSDLQSVYLRSLFYAGWEEAALIRRGLTDCDAEEWVMSSCYKTSRSLLKNSFSLPAPEEFSRIILREARRKSALYLLRELIIVVTAGIGGAVFLVKVKKLIRQF